MSLVTVHTAKRSDGAGAGSAIREITSATSMNEKGQLM